MIDCEAQALLASQAVIVAGPVTAVAGTVMTFVKLPSEAAVVLYCWLVLPWTNEMVTASPAPKCSP